MSHFLIFGRIHNNYLWTLKQIPTAVLAGHLVRSYRKQHKLLHLLCTTALKGIFWGIQGIILTQILKSANGNRITFQYVKNRSVATVSILPRHMCIILFQFHNHTYNHTFLIPCQHHQAANLLVCLYTYH